MRPKVQRAVRARWLIVVLLASALPRVDATATSTAGERLTIDLEAGPLQQGVARLAELTRLQILYDPEILRGKITKGLHGAMTPAEALRKLLAQTDITFDFTAPNAVALHRASSPPPLPDRSPAAPVHTVTVRTNRIEDNGYGPLANVATVKVDAPSLTVPVSAASLTQQLLRDQNTVRLEDVLEFVSGTETIPDGQSSPGFGIRGLPTYQYYLDGVRVSPDLHHDGFRDFANIDHVEVLKGPASLLYGRTEPGGLINLITKQPGETPLFCLEQEAGSFGRFRTQLDLGGPLPASGSLLYRLNAAWERAGSFREISDSRRVFLSPVIAWKPSTSAETTVYLEYLNSHDPTDSGLPLVGNRPPPISISSSFDEGGEVHTTDFRVGVKSKFTVGNGWTFQPRLDTRWLKAPQTPQLALAADGLVASQCTRMSCPIDRQLIEIPATRGHTAYASLEVTKDVSLWRIHHSLLAGIEYFQTGAYTELRATDDFSFTTDLFRPQTEPIPTSLLQNPGQGTNRDVRESWEAAYLQDQLAFGSHLYLLAALRYDDASASIAEAAISPADASASSPPSFQGRSLQAITHREGIVWRPRDPLGIYLKYAENFGTTPGLYVGASSLDPLFLPQQPASEWEAGLKVELPENRGDLTLALFELTKKNVTSPLPEPALNAAGLLLVTGTVRNRGVELDLHGEVLPGLQLLASYAYIDSTIINDPGLTFPVSPRGGELQGITGNRFYGVPRHGGSAWGSYRFTGGALRGFKLGLGVIARGEREGDNANDYRLPGFVRWNALAAYDWVIAGNRLSLQLNVDNLLNARYFESLTGSYAVMPGYPRRWTAIVRWEL